MLLATVTEEANLLVVFVVTVIFQADVYGTVLLRVIDGVTAVLVGVIDMTYDLLGIVDVTAIFLDVVDVTGILLGFAVVTLYCKMSSM